MAVSEHWDLSRRKLDALMDLQGWSEQRQIPSAKEAEYESADFDRNLGLLWVIVSCRRDPCGIQGKKTHAFLPL